MISVPPKKLISVRRALTVIIGALIDYGDCEGFDYEDIEEDGETIIRAYIDTTVMKRIEVDFTMEQMSELTSAQLVEEMRKEVALWERLYKEQSTPQNLGKTLLSGAEKTT